MSNISCWRRINSSSCSCTFSTNIDSNKSNIEGKSSHRLRLFSRENAISGIPNIRGSSQFPNPPINIGITKKKIIKNACAVTIVLYNWLLFKNCLGWASSIRMIILIIVPTIPDQISKMKYMVPISLWLDEYNQRI